MILISQFASFAIECWKITKAMKARGERERGREERERGEADPTRERGQQRVPLHAKAKEGRCPCLLPSLNACPALPGQPTNQPTDSTRSGPHLHPGCWVPHSHLDRGQGQLRRVAGKAGCARPSLAASRCYPKRRRRRKRKKRSNGPPERAEGAPWPGSATAVAQTLWLRTFSFFLNPGLQTKKFDQEAIQYLSYALYPLVAGYSVYSL